MCHRPDDVLWAKRGVSAEEHARVRRCHRCGVDFRHVPLVEINPDFALDPRESVFLADRHQHIIAREALVRLAGRNEVAAPLASYSAFTFSKRTPVRRPFSCVNSFGTRKFRMGMSSCMASSFSQGDAFISWKPERTITLTSSPPSRREDRQQSIAVLPPPSTMTRLPILLTCPKETEESQSMPIWTFGAASLRPGMSRSRPRGAPQPTKTASQPSASSALRLSMRLPPRNSIPRLRM